METKQIKEGDYIRGFKAKDSEFLIEKKYIDAIAKVIKVNSDIIQVQFSDGKTWWYQKDQAIEHLCNDDIEDFEKGLDANANDILKETPFHKPDFNHLKDPKLYSVLLSLGKMRMVYIDQTDEDVEQIKKQSPNWHTIIVEQQQDKGIQIIIKS
jgi:capsule polysaccharide modification protein KpsS